MTTTSHLSPVDMQLQSSAKQVYNDLLPVFAMIVVVVESRKAKANRVSGQETYQVLFQQVHSVDQS